MKNLQKIIPVVAIVVALVGAIYYVRAQAAERPVVVQVAKPAVPTGNTLPPSERYANPSTATG
jgi:hypothetical protein